LRANYQSWKASRRANYLGNLFDAGGAPSLTVWVAACVLLAEVGVIAEFFFTGAVSVQPLFDQTVPALALLSVSALICAAGFWRALRFDAYLLANVCAEGLCFSPGKVGTPFHTWT
jgi:hypothetical protein